MEPSWDALRDHLGAMTVKELRGIGRRWFNGTLGGASGKGAIADACKRYIKAHPEQLRGCKAGVRGGKVYVWREVER